MSARRPRGWLELAAIYAVGWWCGAILDRPHERWWAHGIIAIPLGLLVAGIQYWMARRRHGSAPACTPPLPAPVVWAASCLVAIAALVLAATRNTPAQYAAAVVISTLVVLAAQGSTHQSGPG